MALKECRMRVRLRADVVMDAGFCRLEWAASATIKRARDPAHPRPAPLPQLARCCAGLGRRLKDAIDGCFRLQLLR